MQQLATDWEVRCSNRSRDKRISFLRNRSHRNVGSTQPPTQWIQRLFSRDSDRGVNLTIPTKHQASSLLGQPYSPLQLLIMEEAATCQFYKPVPTSSLT